MCSTIAHRGPDDAGFALMDGGRVGLASVRLRIMDIERGDQPIHNEDGTVTVVLNGEIYDASELREELTRKGHTFRTTSDTEVLVHLYEEEGLDFLQRLNGEYAFVLWDGRNRRLLAARDPMGIKPLHYRADSAELLLCSEAKGILCLDRVPRALAPEYLTSFLSALYPSSRCAFEGIRCVRPGHVLVVESNGRMNEQAYSRPNYDTRDITFDEAKSGLRSRLERAVRRRLVADVPVHAYLSGGLDSTVLCALAARETGRFTAYHVSFPESELRDESKQAAAVARHLGLDFAPIRVTNDLLAENFVETLRHTEMPLGNAHAIANFMLSRRVRADGTKVCLTGQGTDELLAGYPHFRLIVLQQMIANGEEARASALWKNFNATQSAGGPFSWQKRLQSKAPPWRMWPRYHASRNLLRRVFTRDAIPDPHGLARQLHRECLDTKTLSAMLPINAARRTSLDLLNGYILPTLCDRVEMANAVECRTPFLDAEFASFANSLPPEFLVDPVGLREKHVLVEAVRDLLPKDWGRHKQVFLAPPWKQIARTRAGRELRHEMMRPAALRRSGLLRLPMATLFSTLWRFCRPYSARGGRIDAFYGALWGFQILHHLFVENRVESDPEFAMTDRSV